MKPVIIAAFFTAALITPASVADTAGNRWNRLELDAETVVQIPGCG